MDELMRLSAQLACKRVMLDYCTAVDLRDIDRLSGLFARDGVLKRVDTGEIRGRDAIHAFFSKIGSDFLIHICNNEEVDVIGPEAAEGSCLSTVFRSTTRDADGLPILGAPWGVAKYQDRFVKEDDAWKFAWREMTFLAKA